MWIPWQGQPELTLSMSFSMSLSLPPSPSLSLFTAGRFWPILLQLPARADSVGETKGPTPPGSEWTTRGETAQYDLPMTPVAPCPVSLPIPVSQSTRSDRFEVNGVNGVNPAFVNMPSRKGFDGGSEPAMCSASMG